MPESRERKPGVQELPPRRNRSIINIKKPVNREWNVKNVLLTYCPGSALNPPRRQQIADCTGKYAKTCRSGCCTSLRPSRFLGDLCGKGFKVANSTRKGYNFPSPAISAVRGNRGLLQQAS